MPRSCEQATISEGRSWLHSDGLLANQALRVPDMVDVMVRSVTMLVCAKCGEEKPYTDFLANDLQYRKKKCRICTAGDQREWRRNNPEKAAAQRARGYAKWREKFPKIVRAPAITPDGRLCGACKMRKPPEAFRRNVETTDRRMWRCKECINKSHRGWSAQNRDHVNDASRGSSRKSRAANPSRAKETLALYRLKSTHGITWPEYMALIESHDSKCGICQRDVVPIPATVRAQCACVDHDHNTGYIRGILCHACNRAIGMLGDSVELLQAAIAYLDGGGHR